MKVFTMVVDGSTCELALPIDVELKRTLKDKCESLHGSVVLLENYIEFWRTKGFATIYGTHNHILFHAMIFIKVDDSIMVNPNQKKLF